MVGPPAPLMTVPTKPRYPVEMFYVEVRHAHTTEFSRVPQMAVIASLS
jgi:hypothetical protein